MKDIEHIIEGCRKENRNAQLLLYKHYAALMFGICLRYTANRFDAEDVLQEGFVKIFQKINTFRNEGSFEGWMKKIIVNSALNFLRKKKKVELSEITSKIENIKDDINEEEYEIEPEILMKIIQQLPVGCRTVFNLYTFEEHSHKEISILLDINEGTSKSQLARARKLLTKAVLNYKKINDYQFAK